MKIKNVVLAAGMAGLIALSMGFTGSSGSGLTIVNTGPAGSSCDTPGSSVAQCPSGTVIVGGGCEITQGKEAVAEVNPVISYLDQNVFCPFTCAQGQSAQVFLDTIAVCASVN